MPRPRRPATAKPKRSDLFEQRIHRVHELLEGLDAEVTWNDRIVDPDQPSRRRQIDITIKRDGLLTLVECRLHSRPQDVKWIEELIGRRQSLGAHAVIAVSASGFTKGAIAKAKRHNVLLRDLREMSDDEVRGWGESVALTLHFIAYSGVALTLTLTTESLKRVHAMELGARHPIITSVFEAAAELVGHTLIAKASDENLSVDFGFRLESEFFALCGEPVRYVDARGVARMVSRQLPAQVQAYDAPSGELATGAAIIEGYTLGETSIVHDGCRISTHIDLAELAALKLPPLCQFRYASVIGRQTLEHEVLSLSGIEALYVNDGSIAITLTNLG